MNSNGIYQNNIIYDNRQDHMTWSVNNITFEKIDYTKSMNQIFKFDYIIPREIKFSNFKIEVQNAVIKLYNKYNRTLAICVSGRDSEVIVREAVRMRVPCKIYFLQLWDMNNWMLDIVTDISKELNVKLCVVKLSEKQCMEEVIFKSYKIMPTVKPTYVCLPYLFENIPEDELIVCGEGDVAKDNPIFKKFYTLGSVGIPILSTEIVYRLWAQENKRYGEFYFHSSTPELIVSAYNNPLVEFTPPSIQTHAMIMHYWPEMKFRVKTLNWEISPEKNKLIGNILLNLKIQKEWATGCLVPHDSVVRQNCY